MASYELCMIASLMIGTLVQFLQSMGWHDKCYLFSLPIPSHSSIHSFKNGRRTFAGTLERGWGVVSGLGWGFEVCGWVIMSLSNGGFVRGFVHLTARESCLCHALRRKHWASEPCRVFACSGVGLRSRSPFISPSYKDSRLRPCRLVLHSCESFALV